MIGEGLPGCLGLEGCKVTKADGELFETFTFCLQYQADEGAQPYYFKGNPHPNPNPTQ